MDQAEDLCRWQRELIAMDSLAIFAFDTISIVLLLACARGQVSSTADFGGFGGFQLVTNSEIWCPLSASRG